MPDHFFAFKPHATKHMHKKTQEAAHSGKKKNLSGWKFQFLM